MNNNHRKLIITAMTATVFMGVFPPWKYTFSLQSSTTERPAGYALITSPPPAMQESPNFGVALDISRLLVQWSIVIGVTGVGWLLFKE